MAVTLHDEKKLFGEVLVEAGLISREQLQNALAEQKDHGGRIGFNLVRLGFISAEKLTSFLKEYFGVGVSYESLSERQKAAGAIPRHLALYYKIAPIKLDGNVLTIGISSIEHPNLIQALEDITKCKIDPLIFPESEIRSLVDSCYKIPTERGLELFSFSDNVFTVVDASKNIKPLAPSQLRNERDVGEWLRSIVAEAIKSRSREILIKPEAEGSSVYFRRDTFFLSDLALSSDLHDNSTFLLYRLAKLDPLQQQKPQHGRFLVKIQDRKLLMVVSAYPTIYGIRFMLEMFDEKLLRHSFKEVTAPFPDLKLHLEDFTLRARQGMIIITGPEGTGRTSFLYSYLSKCKSEFQQIITLENSVRYPITGLSQIQVSEAEMETALENVLKQKPDLVAVNALRTVRMAELAFLITARVPLVAVMSSYDAFVALDWLCKHNLKSAVKAGLVHALISPRLIPRVCPNCSVPFQVAPDETLPFGIPADAELKMNQGCDFCRNPDNHLSDMIFEFIKPDREMISWLEINHSSSSLRQKARQSGKKTLSDVALQHAIRGTLDMVSVMKLQSVL